jgi:hypothetical protein
VDSAGRLDTNALLAALDVLAKSSTRSAEIIVHPGAAPDDERTRYAWGYRWEAELDGLLDQRVRGAVLERGFELVNYGSLATRVRSA